MRNGGIWVSSSKLCEKGMMRKLCKNALRVFREIKERACVHCFFVTKPLGLCPKQNSCKCSLVSNVFSLPAAQK